MKSKIIAIVLFVITAGTVMAFPLINSDKGATMVPTIGKPIVPVTQKTAKIEVVFVLDTTGSMSGLIQAAKEKIWSIASTMASAQQAPEIKMGLVAYRDRGDAYVTKVIDLSGDLDSVYASLMDFKAAGGGDGPESVNQALHDAVQKISWSKGQDVYKVVFLVGDAPPHMDYQDDVKYPTTIALAKKKGIVINAIQCGASGSTRTKWLHMASLGDGRYFQVEQGGGAVAVSTPFDRKLAELSRKLDDTRLYYGSKEVKAEKRKKVAATDKLHRAASPASRARRATFNASKSGKNNLFGSGDLVEDVISGRVELDEIKKDHLPASVQVMAPKKQEMFIRQQAKRRAELQAKIGKLSQSRSRYLKKKAKESGGFKDSLDEKLYSAVREQAGKKGLVYESEEAVY